MDDEKLEEVATQLITALDENGIKEVAQTLALIKSKRKISELNEGVLYNVGDLQNGYYFLEDPVEGVIYFVRYKQIKANGNLLGRQILVWRDEDCLNASGVARHVFYRVLLPKFKALCADTQQTSNGKRFWFNRLTESLNSKKYYVYALDRRSSPNELTKLNSLRELNNLTPLLWGPSDGHKRTHAVISVSPLKLVPKNER